MRRCGARKSPICASTWAGTAAASRRRCSRSSTRSNGASLEAQAAPSGLFAGVADRLRRAPLGQAPEADHALALDLQAVAAHERFLAVGALHEGSIGALIDQHELVAADLDAGVQARDEVALNHHVVVLGPADGDARMALVDQQLPILPLQAQAQVMSGARLGRDPRHHAGHVLGLPQHLVEGDLASRSEEYTSELQSRPHLVCRLLLEKKNKWKSGDPSVLSTRQP